ncbi:sugar phosphate isomerase/epimerase family protein [Catenovulum sediminis]|uniref:Sugar phosphate isomerase/epimerase family protein n=1 Tax=Catenovulum sediminis TaxID=1740262 RepID=A0ABV1RGW2_9ALTE
MALFNKLKGLVKHVISRVFIKEEGIMGLHLGVMQGRLLPKYQGRYQAHPVSYWEGEFKIAADLGLDYIEFILDYNDCELNPLLSSNGIKIIENVINETGVKVRSICADYFMVAPLHSAESQVSIDSIKMLRRLIINASKLCVTDIVIPCVDNSSLKKQVDIDRLIVAVNSVIPLCEEYKVNLSLETDLPPNDFAALLQQFDSTRVTVNYDIGNSAALGFNVEEELIAYGNRVSNVHIKDRVLGGGPVVLGEGDADFVKVFNLLKEIKYDGLFVMQAYRDEEGTSIFSSQMEWVKPYLETFYE